MKYTAEVHTRVWSKSTDYIEVVIPEAEVVTIHFRKMQARVVFTHPITLEKETRDLPIGKENEDRRWGYVELNFSLNAK